MSNQLSLLREDAVRVKRCRSNLHAQPCWHGYCAQCGEGLSFYDFTEQDCMEISLAALVKDKHKCRRRNQ